jgi:hypothetical protein
VDEMAADGRAAEQLRQLREGEEPVGVPGRPVGIVAVDDPIDDVVRLGGFVEKIRDGRTPAVPGTMSPAPP